MAPTTTIETITITRPLKVIAFICGIIVIILMVMALTSNDWLLADGWRQGLFMHCVGVNASLPLPFNIVAKAGVESGWCEASRDECEFSYKIRPGTRLDISKISVYIKATAILCVIALITDAISTFMTGAGLKTLDANLKYKFYRIAVLIMMVSLLALLTALILYPVNFAAELPNGNRTVWEFGWAYGVGELTSHSKDTTNSIITFFSLCRLGSCNFPLRCRRPPPVRQRV
jgi:PMP-22/EMP/MP20/Claudin family